MTAAKPITLTSQASSDWKKWPRNRHWDGHDLDEVQVMFAFSNKAAPERTYLAKQLNWKGFNDETRITWFKVVKAYEGDGE
ncbi:hypothetical protein IC614_02965 [Allosphingosinicella flava]|uniref:Uncharacterized protein n=1 Tax=Allosphingosinicella flava TaxID=2771430 RepID=A0A7T2GKK7_9SPHN|nr:hypothetical protein [Sphingosinicella flava]QPQ55579.1 hypothetical protein IC614_02965 [Sphingosinicella flava]